MQPRTLASADASIKRIEEGELKLRVRSIELEAQLTRVETRQRMYGTGAMALFAAKMAIDIATLSNSPISRASLGRFVLHKAYVLAAVVSGFESFGAYCGLSRLEKNRRRFDNRLDDC